MVIEEALEIGTQPYVVFISKSHSDLRKTEALYSKLKIGNRIKIIRTIRELFSFMDDVHQHFELPSLVVVDVEKRKEKAAQFLNQWKTNEQFKNIPVLIYSSTLNYQEEKEWMNLGASYCRKKRKTDEGREKLLIECISLADILHEMNLEQDQ
jgi:hypothetical protein